jgi:hypothetical protein
MEGERDVSHRGTTPPKTQKGSKLPCHVTRQLKKNISTRETLRTLSCTLQSSTPAFPNALLVV